MVSVVGASSAGLFHFERTYYFPGGPTCRRLGVLAVMKALLHHFQGSFHLLARRTVWDDGVQLTGHVLGGKVFLDKLGDDLFTGDQVGHGERIQLDQAAAKQPCERRQPVNDDKRSSRERSFNRGRAAGDHRGAGVHERSAGVVGEMDQRIFRCHLSG